MTRQFVATFVIAAATCGIHADITNITQGTTHPTIQDAITNANDFDEIVVDPGEYFEGFIQFGGKPVTVRSQDPEDPAIVAQTIVDGWGETGFICNDQETPDTIISGFVLTGASDYYYGALVLIGSSPTISHCTFQDNEGITGSGITMGGSSALIADCTFVNGYSPNEGGAIHCDGSSPTIRNCIFSGNEAVFSGGALQLQGSTVTLENCQIRHNTTQYGGGAIHVSEASHLAVTNCRIECNDHATSGGGIVLAVDGTDTCDIQDSIICANSPDQVSGTYNDLGGNVIGRFTVPPTPPADPCPEDINGDGVVDQADLGALLAAYGNTCP